MNDYEEPTCENCGDSISEDEMILCDECGGVCDYKCIVDDVCDFCWQTLQLVESDEEEEENKE